MNRQNLPNTQDYSRRRSTSMSGIPRLSNFGLPLGHGVGPSSQRLHQIPHPQYQSQNLRDSSMAYGRQSHVNNHMFHGGGVGDSFVRGTPLIQRLDEAASHGGGGSQLNTGNQMMDFSSQPGTSFQSRQMASLPGAESRISSSNFFTHGRQQAFVPTKDERDWTNRPFRDRAIDEVFEFLQEHGFSNKSDKRPFTREGLSHLTGGPTLHIFANVFEFLMSKLLGKYELKSNKVEEVESEVKLWGKQLGYPFVTALKKSILQQPNIKGNWNVAFGFLHWLMEETRLWLKYSGVDSPFGGIFLSDKGDQISGYYEVYIKLIQTAYALKRDGEPLDGLTEEFRTALRRLSHGEENIEEFIQQKEEELAQREAAFAERLQNYESLASIEAKIDAVKRKTAEWKGKMDELKRATGLIQDQIGADEKATDKSELENQELERKIAEVKKKIKVQPFGKDKKRQMTKERNDQQIVIQGKRAETVNYTRMIEMEQMKKSDFISKLRECTQDMRKMMAEMNVSGGEKNILPDYTDDMSVEAYTDLLRSKIESVVEDLRSQLTAGEIRKDELQKETKILAKLAEELVASEAKEMQIEEEVQRQLAAVEKVNPDSAGLSILREKLAVEEQKLEDAIERRSRLKIIVDQAEDRLEKKTKNVARLVKLSAEEKAALEIKMGKFRTVMKKRMEALEAEKKQLDEYTAKFLAAVKGAERATMNAILLQPAEPPLAPLPPNGPGLGG